MKTELIFNKEPSFAELWDACVYKFLYNPEEYKGEIKELFNSLGVNKDSSIIDVSVGGGFPVLDLMRDGYKIDCFDSSDDQIELFRGKVKKVGLNAEIKKGFWRDINKFFPENNYDFLFCRGNSFIYAAGGWNEMVEIDSKKSIDDYEKTLSNFYDLLRPGGWMYIDKFKDTETTHKEKVCEIKVGNNAAEDLIFWTERFPESKTRKATMLRKKANGDESGLPNITYDLSENELEEMLKGVGFKEIKKINLESEKHFAVWLAQK